MLDVREKRGTEELIAAKLFFIKFYCDDASSFHDDSALYVWDMFQDDATHWIEKPDRMKDDLGLLPGRPYWEVPELALVLGVILAGKAVECFTSQSHKRHLLAASLLADATEARHYWMALRGFERCRNPWDELVQRYNTINLRESRSIIGKQGKDAEQARFHKVKKFCVETAEKSWAENTDNPDPPAHIAQFIFDAIKDPGEFHLAKKPSINQIKNWINPYAPEQAKRPGRPRKQ